VSKKGVVRDVFFRLGYSKRGMVGSDPDICAKNHFSTACKAITVNSGNNWLLFIFFGFGF